MRSSFRKTESGHSSNDRNEIEFRVDPCWRLGIYRAEIPHWSDRPKGRSCFRVEARNRRKSSADVVYGNGKDQSVYGTESIGQWPEIRLPIRLISDFRFHQKDWLGKGRTVEASEKEVCSRRWHSSESEDLRLDPLNVYWSDDLKSKKRHRYPDN